MKEETNYEVFGLTFIYFLNTSTHIPWKSSTVNFAMTWNGNKVVLLLRVIA